jgi:hypothetical protein
MPDRPIIPVEFDPPAWEYESSHLEYLEDNDACSVAWPALNKSILVPSHEPFPDVEMIEKINHGWFKNWNYYGYSIGDYHEFFLR